MVRLRFLCIALVFSPATFGARLPCFGFDPVIKDATCQALDGYGRPQIANTVTNVTALGIPPLDSTSLIGPNPTLRLFCFIPQGDQSNPILNIFPFEAALTAGEACRVAYERSYRMGIPVEPHFLGNVVQALLGNIPPNNLHISFIRGGYFRALDALTFRLRTNFAWPNHLWQLPTDRLILHVHGKDRMSRNTKELFANILTAAPASQGGLQQIAPSQPSYKELKQDLILIECSPLLLDLSFHTTESHKAPFGLNFL